MTVSIQNTELFKNGVSIHNFPAFRFVEFRDVVVAIRYWAGKPADINNNVFGFDVNGRLLWQMRNPSPELLQHATGIYVKDDQIRICFWSGFEMLLDEKTGELSAPVESQRPW